MDKNTLNLINIAENYFKKKNYVIAEDLLNQVIKKSPKNSKANEILGYIYANKGNREQAFEFLNMACLQAKCSPQAFYYLGILQIEKDLTDDAIASFKKAISVAGDFYEALNELAFTHEHLDNLGEALAYHQKCLMYKKDFETYLNVARCANRMKIHEVANINYDLAIKLNPKNADIWNDKGGLLYELGRFNDALACYDMAEKLDPNFTEVLINKSITLSKLGRYHDAIEMHNKAISLEPNNPNPYQSKAILLGELNQNEEAIKNYDHVIKLKPDHAEALLNKGEILNKLRIYKDALSCYDSVIKLRPNYPEAWLNKGVTFEEIKRYDDAIYCYDRAIDLRPNYSEAKTNKGVLNLNLKNFKDGWKDYVGRLDDIFLGDTPLWDGVQRCKHLIIISEQGIGDEVFYLSQLSEVQKRVDKITVMVDKRLIGLLSRSFPSIVFLERNKFPEKNKYDASIPIGNLLSILHIDPTKSSFKSLPYLRDDKSITDKIKETHPFKSKFTCGISWRSSNPKFGGHKSLKLAELNNIFASFECNYINLQYGDVEEDILENERITGVKIHTVNNIDLFNDIDGLLSVIMACDVVVTTSNVTAHLSGAIGKKTFLLLPYSRGRIWYWHDEKINTWYPSVEQFFQDSNLSWGSALDSIALELKKEIDKLK